MLQIGNDQRKFVATQPRQGIALMQEHFMRRGSLQQTVTIDGRGYR